MSFNLDQVMHGLDVVDNLAFGLRLDFPHSFPAGTAWPFTGEQFKSIVITNEATVTNGGVHGGLFIAPNSLSEFSRIVALFVQTNDGGLLGRVYLCKHSAKWKF